MVCTENIEDLAGSHRKLWNIQDPPQGSIVAMELRLVYKGPLHASTKGNSRTEEKHAIRKQLHPQLREFWRVHPHLSLMLGLGGVFGAKLGEQDNLATKLAKRFNRGNHNFLPLVRESDDSFCAIDILFLRRGTPGHIIAHGGDLDNRLKTLMDAIKVPDDCGGLPDCPSEGEDPFFCLLQDDALITSIKVSTDRLLLPMEPGDREGDVLLIIHVHIYRGTNASQVTGLAGSV